jgi:tetratricopeptide (TPR) repeat protein
MERIAHIRPSRKVILAVAVAGALVLVVGYISNVFSFADNVNRVLGRGPEPGTREQISELEQKVWRRPEYLADLSETQDETLRAAYEEARLLQLEGYQAANAEKHKEAVDRFTAAIDLANTDAEMAALHILRGNSYLSIGKQESSSSDFYSALADYGEALALADSISPDSDAAEPRAVALGNLGLVYGFRIDELDKAEEYCQQALEINREIGNRLGEAETMRTLGFIYEELGDLDKAEEYYRQALEINREIGNRLGEAQDLGNLGFVYYVTRRLEKAEEYYQQALEIDREIGNRLGEAETMRTLGFIYEELGDLDRAEDYFKRALEADREIGNRRYEAFDLEALGFVYEQRDALQKAEERHGEALEIFRETGDRREEARELENLGDVYLQRGELEKAEEYLQQALEIHREVGDSIGEAQALGHLGDVYYQRGDIDKAIEYLQQADDVYQQVGLGQGPKSTQETLEDLERRQQERGQ